MSLYRIMLVDDEEEVRKAIIRKMDWAGLGFEVVGDAENGEDALEKLEQLEPDVIMTDIRMPYMDGLALTARIREKYPSMKVLIFSGYDDFEYAQQAIKLGVIEYILKPVNGQELAQILSRVRVSLDEEIEQRRDIDALRENYLGSLPILRELFLNDLVRRTADAGDITTKLREYGIDILGARKWLTAVIYVEQVERREEQVLSQHQELIPISVRSLAEDHLKPYCRFAVFNSMEGITVIAAIDGDNTQTGLINVLNDICKESRRMLEVSITVGVGHSCDTPWEIAHSYQTAVDALGSTKDLDMVTENVRAALSRTITRRFCEHGQLRVVTLDAEVEKRVIASLSKNEQGIYLAMGPDLMQQIVTQLSEFIKKFNDLSQTPIVLTSQVIRIYLSRMLSQFYPNLYVLAFNEITSDVQIQSLGNITLDSAQARPARKAAAV